MAIIFRPTLSGIYQPQLNSQLCNGCGACAASCPVSDLFSTLQRIVNPEVTDKNHDESSNSAP
ncbi:4Fe-4S binding protein, partial [Escherichia coli]|uniref:4Fe-4S binding protein n=1 Tax=Escherichia coli TaxID=562 RepID=UPI002108B325